MNAPLKIPTGVDNVYIYIYIHIRIYIYTYIYIYTHMYTHSAGCSYALPGLPRQSSLLRPHPSGQASSENDGVTQFFLYRIPVSVHMYIFAHIHIYIYIYIYIYTYIHKHISYVRTILVIIMHETEGTSQRRQEDHSAPLTRSACRILGSKFKGIIFPWTKGSPRISRPGVLAFPT